MDRKKIAVLVINYNGQVFLRDCFDSLLSLDNANCADIYLLDNNSQDDSRSLTEKNYKGIEIINTGANLGFSGAYNYAHNKLEESGKKYDYYFILNNDTVCWSKDIYTKTFRLFSDQKVGIVAPTLIDKNGMIQIEAGNFIFLTGTTLGYNSGRKYHDEGLNRPYLSKWASGAAFFIPSSLFQSVGGFEDYFMYQEDVCLSWKVLNKDLKIISDPDMAIIHYAGGTKKESTFEHYYSERNRIIMYWQNLSTFSFVIFLPFFLLLRILLLPAQRNLKIALAKFKGLLKGLLLCFSYPKKNNSFFRDLRTISFFNSKIAKYENPISNT